MKKIFAFISAFLLISTVLAAQETTDYSSTEIDESLETPTKPLINIKFPNITFDEGVSYCQLTRIEKMNDRSNFVRENMMAGAYLNIQTVDFTFFDIIMNFSAYYPFYNAFNGMPQKTKNIFNFALNNFTGAVVTFDYLKFIKIDVMVGMHYMYQLTDEYYMHYIGIGGCAGITLPITKNFSVVEYNFFSYDNANLGSNKNIQLFSGSYQYQINLGVKYTRKCPNKYYYIDTEAFEAKRLQKKADRQAYKEAVEEL